jgi:hypothetical protein
VSCPGYSFGVIISDVPRGMAMFRYGSPNNFMEKLDASGVMVSASALVVSPGYFGGIG